MSYKIKTRKLYGYSRIGACMVCDASFEDMNTALADARFHAQKTGHETRVETASSTRYTPEPRPEQD